MKKKLILLIMIVVLTISACNVEEPQSVENDRKATEKSLEQYSKQVPVPSFSFPFVRYVIGKILELQNAQISTFTYVYSDYQGKIVWSCPSIGYPIPGGTQMTNPEQVVSGTDSENFEGAVTIPQAEPSGVYSPDTSAGTNILCVWEDGTVYNWYEERAVSTVPFPVVVVDGVVVPAQNSKPSATIKLKD